MALIFKYLTSNYHNKWFQTLLAFPEIEGKVKMLISFDGNKAFLIVIRDMINALWYTFINHVTLKMKWTLVQ